MKYIFTIAIIVVFSLSVFAHTDQEIEDELVGLHDRIEKYSSYGGEYEGDDRDEQLTAANVRFEKRLLEVTAQHPSLLKYGFPKLDEKIAINSSPNSFLKIYSWDTLSGGTMHFYSSVFQYAGADGVYSTSSFSEEGDPSGFVTDIFNIATEQGMIFLVSSTTVLSTSYRGQSLSAYSVDGNTLNPGTKVIKTGSGLTDSLSFGYDFFTVVDREERPVRLFKYDSRTKTISFPVVIEDKTTPQGRVTNKMIKYRFDGLYFVKM